jgi:hypothetical protein
MAGSIGPDEVVEAGTSDPEAGRFPGGHRPLPTLGGSVGAYLPGDAHFVGF